MSIAAGGAPSLIMLKPFPCNTQSTAVKNLTLLYCHPTMEDQEEKENQYDNANSPPNQALTRSMGEHGSHEEESEHDAQDDPALLRVEIDVIRSPNMHEVHSVGLSDPMHDEPFHGRTPGMSSNSPFALGADASVQVNSPSLEERNAVEGMAILRSSSRDAALDYMPPGNNRFASQPTDYVARMPTDEAPPPPDDNEFTEGSWSEIPFFPESMHYPFEYPYSYNHHGYHRHQSEDTPTPHVVRATKDIPTTASDDSGNSSLDKKPAAKSRQTQNKKKEKVKVKEEKNPPKRKSRPQKIRTRTDRKSTGSGSDSSPTSQSSGGASRNSRSRPSYYPVPDKEELDAATTERSHAALISWHQRLGELIDYRKKHGNTNVPQKFKKNRGLGVWVNKQRMEKKVFDEGKKTSMTAKKIAKLEKAGFQWAKPKGIDAWQKRYGELREYIEQNGHANVPTKYKKNRALGRWVSTQRNMRKKFVETGKYNNLKNSEVLQRLRALEALGFTWDMSPSSGSDNTEQRRLSDLLDAGGEQNSDSDESEHKDVEDDFDDDDEYEEV